VEAQLERLGALVNQQEVGAATTVVHPGLEQMLNAVGNGGVLPDKLSLAVVEDSQKRCCKI
jgi:hypothetical protein